MHESGNKTAADIIPTLLIPKAQSGNDQATFALSKDRQSLWGRIRLSNIQRNKNYAIHNCGANCHVVVIETPKWDPDTVFAGQMEASNVVYNQKYVNFPFSFA